MLDTSSEFGRRAARRLHEERLAWLTTVSPRGTPQPVPIWFLWDGDASILLYSRPDTPKLRNIAANPRVSLHLDGNGQGGDVVVCLGEARHLGRSTGRPGGRVRGEVRSARRAQSLERRSRSRPTTRCRCESRHRIRGHSRSKTKGPDEPGPSGAS